MSILSISQVGSIMIPMNGQSLGLPISQAIEVLDNPYARQYGGVIRWAKGSPNGRGGQIIRILKDTGQSGQLLSKGANLLPILSGIGAAASVANLAVSAVGFYMMNKKLNQLRSEMEGLHNAVSSGFSQMEGRLVQVQYMLGGLADGQRVLLEGQEEIKDQLDADSFSQLAMIISLLEESERNGRELSQRRIEVSQETLRTVRNRYQILIDQWCRGDKAVESLGFVRGTGYFQLWAMSLIVEARMLRMVGRTGDAAYILKNEVQNWYFPAARDTVHLLLEGRAGLLLSGAFQNRISSDHFVGLEEFRRGIDADQHDMALLLQEADAQQHEFFGATPLKRAHKMRTYNPAPDYSRALQASNLVELGRRMETMALEYDICERQNLSIDQWERAALSDEASGEIHLIELIAN